MVRIRVYDKMIFKLRLEGDKRVKLCGRTCQAERTVTAQTLT